MAIQDIDFGKLRGNMLPPDKRRPRMMAYVKQLLSPLQWRNDLFGLYRNGTNYAAYNAGTNYTQGDRVRGADNAVYESLTSGNTGNATSNVTHWAKVLDNFTGSDERALYNGQSLMLQYALNKWFGGTFVQPPNVDMSDIYTERKLVNRNSFISFPVEPISSASFLNDSSGYVFLDYLYNNNYYLTIYVKQSLYNTIAGGELSIRQFADKYIPSGITYKVETY